MPTKPTNPSKPRNPRKTKRTDEAAAKLSADVKALRAENKSFREIGELLGVNTNTAHRYFHWEPPTYQKSAEFLALPPDLGYIPDKDAPLGWQMLNPEARERFLQIRGQANAK